MMYRQACCGLKWRTAFPAIRIGADRGLVGACIAGNQNIIINDTFKDPRFDREVDRSSGYVTHSVLILPLRSPAGQVLGALQVLNKPGGFEESDVKIARARRFVFRVSSHESEVKTGGRIRASFFS
ncbi:MAG: GAF domain-containing protein [Bryobacteraceae bacterium]